MKNPLIILIVGVIASILVSSFSNWIYDLLKARSFFPNTNKLTVKTILFISVCIIILVLLVALPGISNEDISVLYETLSLKISLWVALIMCLFSGVTGFMLRYTKLRRAENLLTEREKVLSETQKRLTETERRLDQQLGSQHHSGTVIKPR